MRSEWCETNETYLQGHGSVGQEAGLQGVHQVHVVAHDFDSDVLPAQLLGPLRGAVAAVHDQVRTVSVAQAGLPQPGHHYAQQPERPHAGPGVLFFSIKVSLKLYPPSLCDRSGAFQVCPPSHEGAQPGVELRSGAAHLPRAPGRMEKTFSATFGDPGDAERSRASGAWSAGSVPFCVVISPAEGFLCRGVRKENFQRRAPEVRRKFAATHPSRAGGDTVRAFEGNNPT